MNYRHIYHAGNFADVVKHAVLCLILAHLKTKPTPVFALDSHAGVGRYDLRADEAQRTDESSQGIRRLLAQRTLPPDLTDYIAAVAALNGARRLTADNLRLYPGSPWILRRLLRPGDRLAAVELHPVDAKALAREFAADRQVTIHRMDGYQALKALLPPSERRGLVLIDPPFEEADEFSRLANGLRQAHRRWATGIYALWYPIKARRPVDVFLDDLANSGIRRIALLELMIRAAEDPERLNGCGLVIVNPPWRLLDQLPSVLRFLAPVLAQEGEGRWRVEWLVPE
jgi:23S rRNA (adenine2030-N6)-methyltransferase